jgi:hypothetical protein
MTRTTRLLRVPNRASRSLVAIVCAALLAPGESVFLAQATPPATSQATVEEPKLPPEQLDSLVAPIALYPDPLLGQVLVASTYPLEIVQLQQWLAKNTALKDKALTDAVAKQPWDPSIQSMAALPDVVKRLGDDIQWTTQLGNAFLAQQADVMDAVQRMRKKAEGTGALKTNEQQKVETKVVEQKTVIVIEQANPQVVYVPTYNPVVVYGPPVYAYPPIYYPPYYPPSTGAVVAAGVISFGVGIAIGAAWGHGGWGYGCGWGHNDINVNINNSFNRNANINRNTNVNRGGNSSWSHNPQHRGGAPYSNQATASKYGGTARGESGSSRQAGAGQQTRSAGGGAGVGAQSAGGGSRTAASGRSASPTASGASSRAGGGTGGGDRVGSRDVGSSRSSGGSSAFGSSGGYSGASARSSSARGASSAGSRGGSRSGGGGARRR